MDGTSRTIAIAEMSQSGIHWMEPRDLNCETMSYKSQRLPAPKHPQRASRAAAVTSALPTARSHFINENIDPEVLRSLITINGGEDTSAYWNESRTC